MKTTILCLATLFCAAHAHAANLNGTWTGSGTAVQSNGNTMACENVTLKISHTAASLTVNSVFTCDRQAYTIPGGTMEIRGGDLYDHGVKAGTITETTVSLTAKSGPYTMKSDADFSNTTMRLHSVVSVGTNPAPALTFDSSNLRR